MTAKPEKIRFRKRDIRELHLYPSACEQAAPPVHCPRRRSLVWLTCRSLLSILILLGILAIAAFVVLRGGISGEALTREARNALQSVAGDDAVTSLSGASISLDQRYHIALEAKDVSVTNRADGLSVDGIRSVRLGLAPMALLAGEVRIARVEVDGADIRLTEAGETQGLLASLPRDSRGLIDFGAVSQLLFDGIARRVALLDQRSTRSIVMLNTSIRFKLMDEEKTLEVQKASLTEKNDGITLEGTFGWDGKTIAMTGEVEHGGDGGVSAFTASIDGIPINIDPPPEITEEIAGGRVNPAHFRLRGDAHLRLAGKAPTAEQPAQITGQLNIAQGRMDLGRNSDVPAAVVLNFEQVVGSGKIELQPSTLSLGGMEAQFNGAIGPEPKAAAADPAYRFEIVTSSAVSAPKESTEPALPFAVRIAGRYLNTKDQIDFNELSVKTAGGELYGQGRMTFGNGTPETIFLLRIPEMPVAHAKQLWPIDVADGARLWVLTNLYGGKLTNSRIDIAFPGGRFNGPGKPAPLTADEIKADFFITDTRFDVVGDLPPVRDATGAVSVRGSHTTVTLEKGTAYTPSNRQADVSKGTLIIPWGPQRPVLADLDITVKGDAAAIAEIISYRPIDALKHAPFTPEEVSGDVSSRIFVTFPVTRDAPEGSLKWNADIDFTGLDITKPISDQKVTDANGTLRITPDVAQIEADAQLNGIPATLDLTEPIGDSTAKKQQTVKLELDDKVRARVLPALNDILSGPMVVDLGMAVGNERTVTADLTKTEINIPWIGWKKGAGVPAKARMTLTASRLDDSDFEIRNLDLSGEAFRLHGDLTISDGELRSATFSQIRFNRTDDVKAKISRISGGYRADVNGASFDARALIKQITASGSGTGGGGSSKTRLVVNAELDQVMGFNSETLQNVAVSYEGVGQTVSSLSINAKTASGKAFTATTSTQSGAKSVALQSSDAGAVLRFFDYYDRMRGGAINVSLTAQGDGPLRGQVAARDFAIVDEPRLSKIVSSPPPNGGTSLNEAVRKDIDVSRVQFDRGYAQIEKGKGYVSLQRGVVRGPLIGTTFQGMLYDQNGNMSITGTFMPAYGLNRIFGELPILGALLGNGRDRGLIGITYKLTGSAKQPQIIVNPISVMAPGIFRSIFEFQ
ncbi:RNA-binding protein [Phyllobacteriaceae bacterium JZ32]